MLLNFLVFMEAGTLDTVNLRHYELLLLETYPGGGGVSLNPALRTNVLTETSGEALNLYPGKQNCWLGEVVNDKSCFSGGLNINS